MHRATSVAHNSRATPYASASASRALIRRTSVRLQRLNVTSATGSASEAPSVSIVLDETQPTDVPTTTSLTPNPPPSDDPKPAEKQQDESSQPSEVSDPISTSSKPNGSPSATKPRGVLLSRKVLKKRLAQLLSGEAVSITMAPTPTDVAAGLQGLRSLTGGLQRNERALLFFPSLNNAKPAEAASANQQAADVPAGQEPSTAAPAVSEDGASKEEGRGRRQKQQSKQGGQEGGKVLELAMVAVPNFERPNCDVVFKVAASTNADRLARSLADALRTAPSVVVRAAGSAATLAALRAAVSARWGLIRDQGLDLAFSIDFVSLPANAPSDAATSSSTTGPVASEEAVEGSGSAGGEAAVDPEAPAAVEGAAVANESRGATYLMQLTFYKRELPSMQVKVADFATTRSSGALSQLLTDLVARCQQVDLQLAGSGEAQFAVQVLARVVRDAWTAHKVSVGVFLTALAPTTTASSTSAAEASDGNTDASSPQTTPSGSAGRSSPASIDFTATLQLRRLVGAPNLVSTRGDQKPLLGGPVGEVKRNTQVSGLGSAIYREMESAGMYSLRTRTGNDVARLLQALWDAQEKLAAARAADHETAAAAAAAAGRLPPSPVPPTPVALIPELQSVSGAAAALTVANADRATPTGANPNAPQTSQSKATVLHVLEVAPLTVEALRIQDGRVVRVPAARDMLQLVKAAALRNRMYGRRPNGKLLVLQPELGEGGVLTVRLEYQDAAALNALPSPPPPKSSSSSSSPPPAASSGAASIFSGKSVMPDDDLVGGYATDDEYGVGAEAAVFVPQPQSSSAARSTPAAMRTAPSAMPEDDMMSGYATDDEYGVGAEAAVLLPHWAAAAGDEQAADVSGGNGPTTATIERLPWIMFANYNTPSAGLSTGIVAEALKPYDRRCPVWLRVVARPEALTNAVLAVAMSQPRLQERGNFMMQILPVYYRKRDEKDRPFNALTLRLIKEGPGAEPGAAAAIAATRRSEASAGAGRRRASKNRQPGDAPASPTEAAMAAAAAAAKAATEAAASIPGDRRMW